LTIILLETEPPLPSVAVTVMVTVSPMLGPGLLGIFTTKSGGANEFVKIKVEYLASSATAVNVNSSESGSEKAVRVLDIETRFGTITVSRVRKTPSLSTTTGGWLLLFSTYSLLLRGFVRAYTVRATFIAHGVPSTDK